LKKSLPLATYAILGVIVVAVLAFFLMPQEGVPPAVNPDTTATSSSPTPNVTPVPPPP